MPKNIMLATLGYKAKLGQVAEKNEFSPLCFGFYLYRSAAFHFKSKYFVQLLSSLNSPLSIVFRIFWITLTSWWWWKAAELMILDQSQSINLPLFSSTQKVIKIDFIRLIQRSEWESERRQKIANDERIKIEGFLIFLYKNSAMLDFFPITNQHFFFAMIDLEKKTAEVCCFVCHFPKQTIHLRKKPSIIIVFSFLWRFLFFYFAKLYFFHSTEDESKQNWPNRWLSSLKTTFISHYSITLANFCSI